MPHIGFRVTGEVRERLQKAAKRENALTMSEIARRAMLLGLEQVEVTRK